MSNSTTIDDPKVTRYVLTPRAKRRLLRLIQDMSDAARELLDDAATDAEAIECNGYAELRLFEDLTTLRRDRDESPLSRLF